MSIDRQIDKRNRIAWLDLAKCFAIIGVLVDHTNGVLYTNQIIAYSSYFSVSLFVLVMGFTTYRSLARKNKPAIQYIRRRTVDMLVPYTIATIICCTAFSRNFVFQAILNHLLHFDACLPYYYVILYLQLLWVSPILFRCLFRAAKTWEELLIVMAVLVLSVLTTNRSAIMGIYGGGGRLLGGTYLLLLCFGMLMAKHYDSIQRTFGGGAFKSGAFSVCGIALSTMWCVWMARDQLGLDRSIQFFGDFNPPGVSFIVYSVFVAFTVFSLEGFASGLNCTKPLLPLEYIGRNTLPVFLYHILFLRIAKKLSEILNVSNPWINRVLFFSLLILGPLLLDKMIQACKKACIACFLEPVEVNAEGSEK